MQALFLQELTPTTLPKYTADRQYYSLLNRKPHKWCGGVPAIPSYYRGRMDMSMDFNSHPLKRQLIPTATDVNRVNSTDISVVSTYKRAIGKDYYDNDVLYESLTDLVNDKFKPWYCKRFFELGKDEVLRRAAIARVEGKDPRKFFSVLLRNE